MRDSTTAATNVKISSGPGRKVLAGLAAIAIGGGASMTPSASSAALPPITPVAGTEEVSQTTAEATVFFPNPVQDLGDTSLLNYNDLDYPALAPAYRRRLLTELDGSGTLSGRYVVIKSNTGKAAVTVNGAFPAWHRDDERFEQVMAYYWLTESQHYLQYLGFGDDLRPVRNDKVYVRVNQYGGWNAFYYDTGSRPTILLGKGGIDAGEDGEAIVHEYGHAVQAFQFGLPDKEVLAEIDAIAEGFSDYFAVTATLWKAGPGAIDDPGCWLDWISKAEAKQCIRRVDEDKHYPDDMIGKSHADGEIWSSALWHIRSALGDDRLAGRIIIDAQFDFAADESFHGGATKTIAAALRLGGPTAATAVQAAFADRGIG
ncbi:MAG TPA: M36 family metallopeptidase [Acidimicrobiales bacterium]